MLSMATKNLKSYMTVQEAADFLGVCAKTLRRWDESGKLKAKRNPFSNYRLYLKKELSIALKGLR